jgi:hypothetical protein
VPSNVRVYKGPTRAALGRKAGSRTRIQDWYCQDLSAPYLSRRRMLEGEFDPAMVRSTASGPVPGRTSATAGAGLGG